MIMISIMPLMLNQSNYDILYTYSYNNEDKISKNCKFVNLEDIGQVSKHKDF